MDSLDIELRNAITSLSFALDKYPERVQVVPISHLVTESARKNEKRPAYVKLEVPDDLVKALRGKQGEQDLMLLVVVPKEVLERKESRIILPGEVR
jgi:hypothetical protein